MVVYRCLSFRMAICGCIRIVGQPGNAGVFKPLTLLLLLLLAWQAPMFDAISYLVLAGLCASLLGDALTLLPRQRLMYAIGAFFLSHLLYTIYFASQMTLSFFWPLPLVLLVLGALLLAIIWTRLEEYRWPICTFIGMTLVMVWLAGELWFFRPTAPGALCVCWRFVACLSVTLSGWGATIADASVRITRLLRPATLPVTS
ncbi:inner membrane protein [Escherichia coli]|uniref:Inner membrane protein n=1 Tax=Escherichia coli TaxID=562 RepID=A0A2X1P0C5_ECOLX|nr:inner membrane protein [Escherichia coli]